MSALLEVAGLSVAYRQPQGRVPVVESVGFTLDAGRTLGLVGESGSGKSQIALALMGLLPAQAEVSGDVRFGPHALLRLPERERRALRGARMGLVFQDPMTSLNPHLTLGLQLAEVLETHRGASRAAALAGAARMLEAVRIPEARRRLSQYPHELSGGQRQRVMIAMMLLAEPALLIADEPTTALDVTVQAEILALLSALQRDMGLALLLISHDLGVIADRSDALVVLYAGRVMEQGPTAAVLSAPAHPYTQALLACRPRLEGPLLPRLQAIPGQPSRLCDTLAGCGFASRCPRAAPRCREQLPPEQHLESGRFSRCHFG